MRPPHVLVLIGLVVCGCASHGNPVIPRPCLESAPAPSVDLWPGWDESGSGVYYIHTGRTSSDSTCFAWVGLGGGQRRLGRVAPGAHECAYSPDGQTVVYGVGLELWSQGLGTTADARQLTIGGFGCHWPRWDPAGRTLAYSRVLHYAGLSDSTAGLRIMVVMSAADRALMKNGTTPWHARGPVAWSPDGSELAFVDADTIVDGRTRLVVVAQVGGVGRTVGWVDGVPGGIVWLADGGGWFYDSTPRGCENIESARRTWHMGPNGATEVAEPDLGDARVVNGFPFVVSPNQTISAHVGLDGAYGVIVVTERESGRLRILTRP